MNKRTLRISGLSICLVATSLMFAAGPMPTQKYAFDLRDLSNDRFIAALNDLSDQNYAYCVWAIRKDLGYCSLKEAVTNCYPLEIIFKKYGAAQPDEKERYKKLFELLMMAGTTNEADIGTRVTRDELLAAQEIGVLGGVLEKVQKLVPTASQAVLDKDIRALDALLKDSPLLVKMVNPTTQTTLLHDAAQHFSSKDPASVQMFAHLIRKGADYEMPNGDGKSVATLMADTTHQASALYKSELEALKKRAESGFTLDEAKQKMQPALTAMAPHKYKIACGLAAVGLIWWLVRSTAPKTSIESDAPMMHLEQLS